MLTTIVVEGKVLGKKRPMFTDWRIDIPAGWQHSGDRMKLRDLITRVVNEEMTAFRQRHEARRLARIMSRADIEREALSGKVDPGERDLKQEVNVNEAVATALQAFGDGLYFVFVDGVQQTNLESEVYLKADSKVTFLRLVALAGG